MSRARPARINADDIHNRVHALNKSVQRQLKDANRRYMELYEWHERDKEQWTQQMQSVKQRMMIMYNYFEQIRSGGSLSST